MARPEQPDRPQVVIPALGRPSPAAAQREPLAPRSGPAAFRADGGNSSQWALRAASVAGLAHRLSGRPSQDAYGWVQGEGSGRSKESVWLAAAVADGVSAADRGGLGADVAVRAALGATERLLGDTGPAVAVLVAAVQAAAGALREVPGGPAAELATTLVVAIASAGGCWVARVGDSSAWLLSDGELSEIFDAGGKDCDLVRTATAALPDGAAETETAEISLGAGQALLLASDGIGDPLRDGPSTVVPAFAEVLAGPPHPMTLGALVDFSRQGCTDDRTLLGIWAL